MDLSKSRSDDTDGITTLLVADFFALAALGLIDNSVAIPSSPWSDLFGNSAEYPYPCEEVLPVLLRKMTRNAGRVTATKTSPISTFVHSRSRFVLRHEASESLKDVYATPNRTAAATTVQTPMAPTKIAAITSRFSN